MVLYNEDLHKKHTEICNKLNLDSKTASAAWESYNRLNKNFTLEGDPQYWLGCAIYIECSKSVLPTVGSARSVVEGNCISISSLLRYCNLSLGHFFSNIKKWIVMAKVSDNLNWKISQLERKFSVSYGIFKVFVKLYSEAFRIPTPHEFLQDIENAKQHRSRKPRSAPCTAVRIFEFCWHLFITIKAQDSAYSTDLVKSGELLIACLDLFFKNAFVTDRKELVSPDCKCEPVDWLNSNLADHKDTLIDILSRNVAEAVNATSVIQIRVYELPTMLRKVFEDMDYQGNQEFTDLFTQGNFESNFKRINNTYSTHLLKNGDLDERMLFIEYRRKVSSELLLTPSGDLDGSATDSPRAGANISDTPLTGRRYLGPKEYCVDTRASLNTMLNGRKPEPSEMLLGILQSCYPNPTEKIKSIVSILSQKFTDAVSDRCDAKNKLDLATRMFYKFVESLLQNEVSMEKDISLLVQHDVFYEGVFTCCLEIVLHAYGFPYRFPWILRVFNIEAWNLLKVIELIIRSKDSQLSRFSIKHLSMVEENILDHLMWKTDSYLWSAIMNAGHPIPKLEDVALPGHLVYKTERIEQQSPPSNNNSVIRNQLQSPGPSAADCFQSPVNQALSVSRQLFASSQNAQSVIQRQTHLLFTNRGGTQQLIPILTMGTEQHPQQQQQMEQQPQPSSPSEGATTPSEGTPSKPRLGGSLAITFRKFYNLAGVRLDHLCTKLGLMNMNRDLIHKIWTLFQDSVVNTDLMKERHLDQLLMCAVYVACVLSGYQIMFSDIMRCYRDQPQARNFIYRNVLIKPKRVEEQDGEHLELPEERNDLIFFYNNVYIIELNKSISNLNRHALSPLPAPRKSFPSPSVEIARNVFIKNLESPSTGSLNAKTYNYYFSRSPSKDLKDINKAINSNSVTGKRLLIDSSTDQPNKRIADRKVQNLIEERKSQISK